MQALVKQTDAKLELFKASDARSREVSRNYMLTRARIGVRMAPSEAVGLDAVLDALDGAEPVFESYAKLAEAVARVSKYGADEKSKRSFVTFLAQIRHGRRRCPDELRVAILTASERALLQRGDTPEEVAALMARLEDGLATPPRRTSAAQRFEPNALFSQLLEESKKAKTHFILTALPAEAVSGPHADQLKQVLIDRLGLAGSTFRHGATRYVFHFPQESAARFFWSALLDDISGEDHLGGSEDPTTPLSAEVASQRLRDLDLRNQLQTWIVDPYHCASSTVVFDPDEQDTRSGYHLYYHREQVSICQMDPHSLDFWFRNLYWQIEASKRSGGISRLTFDDAFVTRNGRTHG
jgi:hypothetical protein